MVHVDKVKTWWSEYYDGFSKDSCTITVTEWGNGMGFDVDIDHDIPSMKHRIQLTYQQLETLNIIFSEINKDEEPIE